MKSIKTFCISIKKFFSDIILKCAKNKNNYDENKWTKITVPEPFSTE